MRVLGSGGVSLAVRTWGDPGLPVLVCVHGYPDDSAIWNGVAAELSDRFHVVAYDVRGAGASDKPRRRRDYRLEVLQADFTAVLDAVSPSRPVHVLAHDWGSIQSWHFVTSSLLAGRIASFTSISGPCLDHVALRMRTGLRPALGQLARSWYIILFQLPLLPELVTYAIGRPNLARGIQLYRANMLPRLLHPEERRTDVPVQIIAPSRDPFVSARMQHEVSRWAPNLRTHTVQGGHWLPRKRAAEIARLVTEHVLV